ncbi:MAG: hypothetical protein NZ534_11030, partial [Bacteroidia bacterium]|nr:hypothetical protein [Bacteroidia bacterium]
MMNPHPTFLDNAPNFGRGCACHPSGDNKRATSPHPLRSTKTNARTWSSIPTAAQFFNRPNGMF